ncbi:thiamine ABC transporter substrate binding subunit [Aestuariispira ectoiniformans]|uniref:thiamine ABC transporter substrate binding subunit n=1 Tax=Aestuariispira ectoiniformans TaxID=2775080 RepID=UPI00223A7F84|nr:thiamine ABC transporter substrate binding subunit [Aestuariispira ectoiniformans]
MKTFLKSTAAIIGLVAASATAQAADNVLTVYTYDSFTADWGPGPAIEKAFEAECNCDLQWVAVDGSASLLSRLQLEGDSSKADVALGLDMNLLQQAKDTGLFAKHGADLSALTLPIDWKDDSFVPFDYGYFSFVYDSKSLANPPKSLKELVDAPDDLTIVVEDPRTSTPGLGLLLWVKEVYGDKAEEAWAKLAPKIVTTTKGWTEAYGMFLEGEAKMVLSYTTSPAYHIEADKEDRYKAAAFDEGHYMQVEVAAKLKNSSNPELATKFLNFIMQDGFQDTIPMGNWMYPVTALKDGLPASFDTLVQPSKSLLIDSKTVADNRRDWTQEWLTALSQ